jgi:uncharacterized protein (UPF0548 family)
MDFARAADAVTTSRFEQAGFALETRLSSGAVQAFSMDNVVLEVIPEPSTALTVAGLACLLVAGRRRRHAQGAAESVRRCP